MLAKRLRGRGWGSPAQGPAAMTRRRVVPWISRRHRMPSMRSPILGQKSGQSRHLTRERAVKIGRARRTTGHPRRKKVFPDEKEPAGEDLCVCHHSPESAEHAEMVRLLVVSTNPNMLGREGIYSPWRASQLWCAGSPPEEAIWQARWWTEPGCLLLQRPHWLSPLHRWLPSRA